MRKIFKGISVALAMTLTMGLFTGCGNKVKEVTYDYNAAEYITVGNYKGVEVSLGDYTVTDADLQNVIEQIREKYMEYTVVDRVAKEGDMVVATFDAYISGGKVEGFSGKDVNIIIGSDEFIIDGFEDALIGLGAGEKRAITGLSVPEDFAMEEKYQGRAITFNIDIAGIYEPVLPEYNDEFITKLSSEEYTTVDAYNKMLMDTLEENAVINKENDRYNAVFDAIMADTEIIKDLPAEYIASKVEAIKEEASLFGMLNDVTEEEYIKSYYDAESAEDAAKKMILLEFIYQEVIAKEGLTVTEKYYRDNIEETAKKRGYASGEAFVEKVTESGVVKSMLLDQAEALILNSVVEK